MVDDEGGRRLPLATLLDARHQRQRAHARRLLHLAAVAEAPLQLFDDEDQEQADDRRQDQRDGEEDLDRWERRIDRNHPLRDHPRIRCKGTPFLL